MRALADPIDPATTSIDLAALKARQQAAWSSGDYSVIGTTLQIVGEDLCEALDVRSGHAFSTWPPETAMRRSPPRGVGAR